MLNREQRYADSNPRVDPWLKKAKVRALELLDENVWIKTGLEKQIWKDTGALPSVAGTAIRRLVEDGKCWTGKREHRHLHIIKKDRHQKIPQEFDESHKRLDKHLQSKKYHGDTLEVLINLALYLLRKEYNYDVLIIPDFKRSGTQFDSYLKYFTTEVCIEARNKTGNLSGNNTLEYLDKCNKCYVKPAIYATWMDRTSQDLLKKNNGFFLNTCRIYTSDGYSELSQDLKNNGFDNVSILDFTRWGWDNATEAKKWLNKKENEKKHEEIILKANNIYNNQYKHHELIHLLQKIRGTFKYMLLKIHAQHLLNSEKDLRKFGSKKFTIRDKEKLSHIPNIYLTMLFSAGKYRNINNIIYVLKDSGYLKKQNMEVRKKFIQNIMNYLTDFKAVKRHHNRWIVDDAKTPYIDANDIF